MELRILGCHSATPKPGEFPSSQALLIHNQWILLDAGEGTQMQLRRYGVKFSRIKHIFITHLHGDHVYGLFGLLSTFRLLNRQTELHVHGPEPLKPLLKHVFQLSQVELTYPLHLHAVSPEKPALILDEKKFTVSSIPLNHRTDTTGYIIREKPAPRKLNTEAIKQYPEIDIWAYNNLKAGKDIILDDGRIIPNNELTFDPPPPKSYAYITDTAYLPDIVPRLHNIDVLYHEATFACEDENLATKTFHSTACQAARIARAAQVKKLILGHFSSRYRNLNILLNEAQKIFPETELAFEGKHILI